MSDDAGKSDGKGGEVVDLSLFRRRKPAAPTPNADLSELRPVDRDLLGAAYEGVHTAVQDALDKGANVNAHEMDGRTALFLAVDQLDYASIGILLKAGADPNIADLHKESPLGVAAYRHDSIAIPHLRQRGADPDHVNLENCTPLILAVTSVTQNNIIEQDTRIAKIVDALTYPITGKPSANPDLRDENGMTAMMYAATAGYSSTIRALLKAGADSSLKVECPDSPYDGQTAADLLKFRLQDLLDVQALLRGPSLPQPTGPKAPDTKPHP
jgi:ankyrin repeat protein